MIKYKDIERQKLDLDLSLTCEIEIKESTYDNEVFAKKYKDSFGHFWKVSFKEQEGFKEIQLEEEIEEEFQFYLSNHDNVKAAEILAITIQKEWDEDYTEDLDKEEEEYGLFNYYSFYGVKPSDFF